MRELGLMHIIFVHLNTPIPRHLMLNISATKRLFPQHEIVLIHNNHELKNMNQFTNINLFEYKSEARTWELDSIYNHPKNFRGNFWLTSTIRFFALEQYANTINEEVIHLESDVIIAKDFPFNSFAKLDQGLAFPIISNERGVGSVIYIRDSVSAALLTSNILKEASLNPQTTEMLMLKKLLDSERNKIAQLPIGPPNKVGYNETSFSYLEGQFKTFDILGGIFDGVDIGQFFLGTDPKNRRGRVLSREDLVKGFAKIKNWHIKYNEERQFIDLLLEDKEFISPIYALHVAVKEEKYFNLDKRGIALRRAVERQNLGAGSYISPKVFVRSVLDWVKRRSKRFFTRSLNKR